MFSDRTDSWLRAKHSLSVRIHLLFVMLQAGDRLKVLPNRKNHTQDIHLELVVNRKDPGS